MRLWILPFLLCAARLVAAPADVLDHRQHFESGSHWDAVTTVNLAAGDDDALPSSGNWTINSTDATNYFHISTNTFFRQTNNYTVKGVHTNQTDTGTRSLAVNYNTPANDYTITRNLGAAYNEISGWVYVDQRIGNLLDGNTFLWDQILFETASNYRVIQRVEGNPAGYQTHSSHASSVGNRIAVPVGRHLISFYISRSALTFKFAVFDADTRAMLGGGVTTMALDDAAVTTIKFSTDGHGGSVGVTNHWGDLVVVTNTSFFPLVPWPTNVYYIATTGSDANSGLSPEYPWLTFSKAASTCVSNDVVHAAAGNYDERVSESTGGVTYVADGDVTVRGFQITGPAVQVVGIRATHASNFGYAGFDVSNARGVKLIDCITTNTSSLSLDFIPRSDFITIRGGHFSWPGYPNGSILSASKIMQDGNDTLDGTTNVLFEYNTLMETGDYITPSGADWVIRNNRFGPTTTAYALGVPHVDGLQANARSYNMWQEANWHGPNLVSDSHFNLIQDSAGGFASGWIIAIKNVSIDSGDDLLMEIDTMTNHLAAFNTFANVGASQGASTPPGTSIYYQNNSTGNRLLGNIFTNTFTSNAAIAQEDTGGDVIIGENLTHTSTAGTIDGNPLFVNFATPDLRIQTTSPAKDVGPALCVTGGAGGTGTTISIAGYTNIYFFADTFGGMIRGTKIYVGNDNDLEVVSRDVANSTITISSSITWAAGENVGYAYRGSGPDLGAYEFGDTLLSSASISNDGLAFATYTVVPVGDTRFVVFYADGVPQAPDYDSPYTYTEIGNEVVTAKAYALHPQPVAVFTAGASAPAADPVLYRNKGRSMRIGGGITP